MAKLYAVPDAPEPVTVAGTVRKRLRETKHKAWPQCIRCNGREYIETRIGTTKQKLCAACFLRGERIVVS